jgi:transposase
MNKPAIKRQKNNSSHPDSENANIVRFTHEDTKLRRSQVAKQLFQNPEYRATVFARLRSPEFQAKGRIARAKRFKADPDIFKRRGKTLKDHKLEKLKQLLGGDPKQVLEDLYIKQGFSMTDIAHHFHKTPTSVSKWFKRFGITTNPSISTKTKREQLKQLLGGDPKEVLENLHIKQGLSQTEIAHRVHRSPWTVGQWFKRFGIVAIRYKAQQTAQKTGGSINSDARELVLSAMKNGSFETLPQRQKELLTLRYLQTGNPLTFDEIAEKMGGISRQRVHELEKATLKRLQGHERRREYKGVHLRQKLGGDPKEVLEELHLRQGLSQKDIAYRFGVTHETVRYWFKKFGIPLIQYPNVKSEAATERTHTPRRLRQKFGGDPKEVLESLYTKQRLSVKDIAHRFHTSEVTIKSWFKKYGITLKEA